MLMVGINFSNDPQHHTQISCSFFFRSLFFFIACLQPCSSIPPSVACCYNGRAGPWFCTCCDKVLPSMSWEVKAWSILDGGCPADRSVDGHWVPRECPARGVQVLNSEPLPTPDHCLIYAFNQFSEERLRQSQCFLAVRWLA